MASDAINKLIENRGNEYGDYRTNFTQIAGLWTEYLRVEVTPRDVAILMVLLKAARTFQTPYKADTYRDINGYCEIARRLHAESEGKDQSLSARCDPDDPICS